MVTEVEMWKMDQFENDRSRGAKPFNMSTAYMTPFCICWLLHSAVPTLHVNVDDYDDQLRIVISETAVFPFLVLMVIKVPGCMCLRGIACYTLLSQYSSFTLSVVVLHGY